MSDSTSTTAFAPDSVTTIFVPPANSQNRSFGVSFAIDDSEFCVVAVVQRPQACEFGVPVDELVHVQP